MSNSIPNGWELGPLSSLANYHNGRAFKPEDWSKNGLPIIRIAQISNPNAEMDHYSGTDVSEKNLIRNGDLLFSWSATLTALIWQRGDAVLNQHIFKVEEKHGTDRKFLHQLILHSIDRLADYSHGSTMKHIKKGVLDEFFAPVPPDKEQKKIASILTAVDDVIESTQAQINKLKDLKTGMMQDLLTKGIGHTEFKDSPVGRIPVEWEVKELNEVVDQSKPITYGIVQAGPDVVDGVPYIRVSDMVGRELQTAGMLRTSLEIAEKFKRSSVNEGDIVYALRGMIGHVQKVPTSLDGANLTQGTARISRSNLVLTDYLLWALKSPYVALQNDMQAKGSTFREITLASLRAINVCIPSKNEQSKIASILNSVQTRVDRAEDKLASVQSIKKALMQDLLTGKVRVNTTI